VVKHLATAFDLPGDQQPAAGVFGLQLADAGLQLIHQGVFVGAGSHFDRLGNPAERIGRNETGFDVAAVVDRHQRAAVGLGLVGRAALGRSAIVGDSWRLVDRLAMMLAAEGHVVNPIAFGPGRGSGAVGDANRKQPVGVAMKTAVVELAALVAADALDLGERLAFSLQSVLRGTADRENRHILGQRHARRPRLHRVDIATGPVDRDAMIGQALEFFLKKNHGSGAHQVEVNNIAGKQQRVGPFGQSGLEHLGRGLERSVEKQLAQVRRHLGNASQGAF
jgi:hypothetical protein